MTTAIGADTARQRTSVSSPHVPADATALRGRDSERGAIRELLGQAQRGSTGVVLVEGEPGIGKSRLLRDGCQQAEDRAFSVLAGAADPLAHATPLFTLRAALREPLTGQGPGQDHPDAPSPAYHLARLRSRLEQHVASAPLLICLDDLHCESEGTLAALRSLQRDLSQQPVAWLLARSSTVRGGAAAVTGRVSQQVAGLAGARLEAGHPRRPVVLFWLGQAGALAGGWAADRVGLPLVGRRRVVA